MAVLAGCLAVSAGDAPNAAGRPDPTAPDGVVYRFSSSQRFSARGADPNVMVPFLAWVEDVAARLERVLGEPLPAARGAPMVFVLGSGESAPRGGAQVRRIVRMNADGLGQRIEIPSPDSADPAEVLAATVSMLLARHVAARQTLSARAQTPAMAPDWFSYGLAGSMFPAPRSAFQRQTLDRWQKGEDTSPDRLLTPDIDPSRALAMMAQWTTWVAWLQSFPEFRLWTSRWLSAWSVGHVLTTDEISATLNRSWTAGDLARQWDLAIASIERMESPGQITQRSLIRRLRAALVRSADRIPIALPPDAPDPVTLRVLLERRTEAWSPLLARILLADTVGVPAGNVPEIESLAQDFTEILTHLANPAPSGFAGAVRRRIGAWRLARRIGDAERRLDDLEAFIAAAVELNEGDAQEDASAPTPVGAESRAIEIEAQRAIFHDAFHSPPSR